MKASKIDEYLIWQKLPFIYKTCINTVDFIYIEAALEYMAVCQGHSKSRYNGRYELL